MGNSISSVGQKDVVKIVSEGLIVLLDSIHVKETFNVPDAINGSKTTRNLND